MKVSVATAPGETRVLDVPKPTVGPADVLVKIRACGICGSDTFFIAIGGVPPRQGHTPLGHEPAGEVVEVGSDVTGIAVGANWEKYAVIVSHTIPFDDVVKALKTASTPGAADKVVVTFN